MLNSNLCRYSDVHTLFKGTITFLGAGDTEAAIAAVRNNKQVVLKKLYIIYELHKQNK